MWVRRARSVHHGLLACAWQSLPPSRLLVDEVVLLAGRQVEAERLAEVVDQSRRLLLLWEVRQRS